MIKVSNLTLDFGNGPLFKNADLSFLPGNCYGIIGANGSGKSSFLKILCGDITNYSGEVSLAKKLRMSVLRQNHSMYNQYTALETVIMGNKKLYEISKRREVLYSKENLSDEEGNEIGELESEFGELGGYTAENDAEVLLHGLGIDNEESVKLMSDLDEKIKLKILLAQTLFGDPDILLLDEPTNGLDIVSIKWLENFLIEFKNTVIVVSHDRHFLNNICTHIVDIDFAKMNMYTGNYDFWYESSQLIFKQMKDQKKKDQEKAEELKKFIARFSANASKSKQATSRAKLLEKLDLTELPASSRKFPYISFTQNNDVGRKVLEIKKISFNIDEYAVNNFSLVVDQGDKIAFIGSIGQIKSAIFDIIGGVSKISNGEMEFGQTISLSYFAKDNNNLFENDYNVFEWLSSYSTQNDESYVRGYLGRMLFSQDEAKKPVKTCSGGEKVRLLLCKMMMEGRNFLMLDEPTNHLDLEAITSLNKGLMEYKGIVMFASHDYEFIQSIANRIIEITPSGYIDKKMQFEDYINDENIAKQRALLYKDFPKLRYL